MVPIGLVLKMAIGGSDKFLKIEDNFIKSKKTPIKNFKLNFEQSEALKFLGKVNKNLMCLFYKGLQGQEKL